MRRPSPRTALLLLGAYVCIPAALVLGPLPVHLLDTVTWRIQDLFDWVGLDPASVQRLDVERVSNILIFAPVGLFVAWALPKLSGTSVLLICAAAATAIELFQWAVLSSRYPSGYDVLFNTSGAAIGITVARSRA